MASGDAAATVVTADLLRVGVIGLGVGEQHLKAYLKDDRCQVRAICDVDRDHLDTVAHRRQVERRELDWRAITEDPEIDVVSICSYDDGHAQQVVSALSHGKHVMVEKPICLHAEELSNIIAAWKASGRRLSSNLILRRSPRFLALKEMLARGDFGRLYHLEGDYIHEILWKLTEGWRGRMAFYNVLYGGGIHLIDLMRWLIGEEIIEIFAMGNNLMTAASPYQYDDTVTALIRFESGATGKCLTTLGPRHPKFHSLKLFGEKMSFVNDMPDGKLFTGDAPEDFRAMTVPYPGMAKGDLIPDFIDDIQSGGTKSVAAEDVFRVMAACLAGGESLRHNRNIDVLDPLAA